ncbi:uncharacterized protein LOC130701875 [Daphnia carinata]|uniref:uncharacterized protein LOC130701875 n=1 Tax=Daphnia carinata TaxID=120202 RepID=UPI00257FCF69|nr:uncharacterized protein LOC130701875 [Daphnia carinata]
MEKSIEKNDGSGELEEPGSWAGPIIHLSFISLMLLVMSFASLAVHIRIGNDTYAFKNMGLWEFCFSRFQSHFPLPATSQLFHLLSKGWLMAVQAFMTLALIFSCSAHIASTMLLVRWPLNFTFRYQWQILSACALMNGLKSFCLFLLVAVFGGQCWRRDWMLYPNFNYLSWSYAFAVIAMFIGMAATASFYFDAKRTVERKKANSNLVVQMQSHGSQIYI